tara:strand:+ start:1177 stop:2034 length:858 start_codon:yes stop_codon:yes gene_type:complete
MKVSIIVPTFNNLKYLKFFILSIKKNSNFEHQLILHVNDGSDGTLNFAKENKIEFTYSDENIGLCKSLNKAAHLVKTNYILYAHDDMFFCKNWDIYLKKEIEKINHNLFYLAGTNVSINKGLINYDCGSSPENFNEDKFNNFCTNDNSNDLQSSHWAPHLIHKDLWNKVKGFSEEFSPGDGSDPDFCMKLWNNNVRIFKSISKFKVYHFNSVTTRKSNIKLNNGTKTFILKYKFNPKFFRKYYLKGEKIRNYKGELSNPVFSFSMFLSLIVNRFKFLYFKILDLL